VRHPGQPAKIHIVPAGNWSQRLHALLAQLVVAFEAGGELLHGVMCRLQQLQRLGVVVGSQFKLVKAMLERGEQGVTASHIRLQVILQIGVSGSHPHVAQHLEQHAGRASCAPAAAKLLDQPPHLLPKETDHNLPVGKGGVIEGYLADALGHRIALRTANLPEFQGRSGSSAAPAQGWRPRCSSATPAHCLKGADVPPHHSGK